MTISKQTKASYDKFRKAGCLPPYALHAAKTVQKWESDPFNGYEHDSCFSRIDEENAIVRVRAEHEQDSYFDVYGKPEGYENKYGKWISPEQETEEICEMIERNGCYCVISEFRDESGEWEIADTIGMCVGYNNPLDPLENCYVIDLMNQAMEQAQNVLDDQKRENDRELIEDAYTACLDV